MKTIYAVLEGKKADMATNFDEESFRVEYNDDIINKEIFINLILLNAFNMGGESLCLFIQDKKIRQYTTVTVSLDEFYSNEPFEKINKSFSIRNAEISLVD
jgi:hypothetical protein